MSRPGLRHRPVREILEALGLDVEDPRCPRCSAAILVCDDRASGVSIRCSFHSCRFVEWTWPSALRARLDRERTERGTPEPSPRPLETLPDRRSTALAQLDRIVGTACL